MQSIEDLTLYKALTFCKRKIAWAILSTEMHSCILYIFLGHCPLTKLSYPSLTYKGVGIFNFLDNLQHQHFSKNKNNGSKINFNIS